MSNHIVYDIVDVLEKIQNGNEYMNTESVNKPKTSQEKSENTWHYRYRVSETSA